MIARSARADRPDAAEQSSEREHCSSIAFGSVRRCQAARSIPAGGGSKVWKGDSSRPASPPIQRFFYREAGIQRRIGRTTKINPRNVLINNTLFSKVLGNMSKTDDYFSGQEERAFCSVCDRSFLKPRLSRREVCSPECKRERALRYGAAYRQFGRDERVRLKAMFDGRTPTADDFLKLVRARRSGGSTPQKD